MFGGRKRLDWTRFGGVNAGMGSPAGGGIDLLGRALARHFGKHLAGNPAVVVQDMPGAGGIRAANFIAETAPKDGTAIGTFAGGPILEPLIGARHPGYDMSKFTWIGTVSKDVGLCIADARTPLLPAFASASNWSGTLVVSPVPMSL